MIAKTRNESAISPDEQEHNALKQVHRALQRAEPHDLKLITSDGQEVSLPESAARALQQAVEALAENQAVVIAQVKNVLTEVETARLLNVPLTYVASLLDSGALASQQTDGQRTVRREVASAFKARRDLEREFALSEIARVSQEAGLYDR